MNMYLDYADMSAAFSQKEEALSNYDNALIIGERLAEKYKDNVQMRFTPSITLSKLGKLYADSGDTKKAKDYYEQALDVRVKLLEENPNDIRLLNDVAVMYITIAEFLSHTPDKAKMIEYLEKRKLVVEKIMTVDPSENSLIMLLDAYLMLIDYYFANNKPQDCANNIEDLKKHLAGLMGKQVSENVLTRIALMHLKSAQLLKDMNNPEQVENNLNAALQLWQQLYDATKKNIYKDNIDKAKEMFNK